MHYHRRQSDLWVPIGGAMAIGLYDVRPGTPADPPGIRVDVEPGVALYIPRGVAHGYVAVRELTLLYLVDRTYDGGADEHGFMPLDPAIGFDWPVPEPTLSERDRRAPSIAEALASDPVDPFVG